MATIPEDEPERQATVERMARAVIAPIERTPRTLAVLAIAAVAVSYAPDLLGALGAAALIGVTWDLARKK